MTQKQLINWWQKWLYGFAIRLAVTVVLTIVILGILGIYAPISSAIQDKQTAFSTTVYRSPDCSCCGGWIDHLKANGFEIKDYPTLDIEAIKHMYSVPDNLTSCHTAVVNGYIIEGHVPARDIKHLLQEKPNVSGLSVPQMPVGTPGMEMGNKKDPFSVFSFNKQGKIIVFNNYPVAKNTGFFR